MDRKVLSHLQKVDPILYSEAKKRGAFTDIQPKHSREYLPSLCFEIINQQLSDKAADSIGKRFLELFPRKNITVKHILSLPDQDIRNAGLSWSKVGFLKSLAQSIESKELDLKKLPEMEDQKVIDELTKVKGIGQWTAEMFLLSALGREDVFSHGDIGLRRGIEKMYGLSDPSFDEVESITIKWSPYRSWGSRVLWQVVDD